MLPIAVRPVNEPPDQQHSGYAQPLRPRAIRYPDCVVLEATDGHDYRVSMARLRSYYEVLRVARYLAERPRLTGQEIAEFITVACNAAGLDLPRG